MIDDDDVRGSGPAGSTPTTLPRNLVPMSIEALHDYIAELEAEITRVQQDITVKQGLRSDAEKVFGSND